MEQHPYSVDKTGVSLSAICLIHCLAGPLLFTIFPALDILHDETRFHAILGIFLLAVGFIAFYRGYRHHHRKIVLLIGVLGFALIVLGVFLPVHSFATHFTSQTLITSIGSTFLITAHVMNMHSCQYAHDHDRDQDRGHGHEHIHG